MPSLPVSRRWNGSLFRFLPDYAAGPHMSLVRLYAAALLLPTVVVFCVICWPLASLPDDSSSSPRGANASATNNTSSRSPDGIVSHASYAVFQLLYTVVSFGVQALHSHALVPGMPWWGVAAIAAVGQGAIQAALAWLATSSPSTIVPILGVSIYCGMFVVTYAVFIVVAVRPSDYRTRMMMLTMRPQARPLGCSRNDARRRASMTPTTSLGARRRPPSSRPPQPSTTAPAPPRPRHRATRR